jgi:signal transduction histidine kinase
VDGKPSENATKAMMRLTHIGRFFGNAGSIIALVLVAVIVPTICVFWLMIRASENEALALEKAIDRTNSIRARYWAQRIAERAETLRYELLDAEIAAELTAKALSEEQWVYINTNEVEFSFLDSPEVEVYLSNIHYLKETLGPQSALALIDDALESEASREWFYGGGRWFYPALLLLAIDLSGDPLDDGNQPYRELLYEWILQSYELPLSHPNERMFWIQQLGKSGQLDNRCEVLLSLETWHRSWNLDVGFVRSQAGMQVIGEWVVFYFPNTERIWFKPIEEYRESLLSGSQWENPEADFTIQLRYPGEVTEKREGERLDQVDTGFPLLGWRLELLSTEPGSGSTASSQKVILYVWVGLLSIVLSMVLGLAGLSLIRKKLAETQLKNDLVATVSHELKTPVASIRMFAETLLHEEACKSQKAREYLQLIHNENERLGHLVEKFLSFSKLERGGAKFEPELQACEEFLAQVGESFRERFKVDDDEFSIVSKHAPSQIIVDSQAMQTAIWNLLENAYRHSSAPRKIELACYIKENRLVFSVSDNGHGIPKEEQKKVFQKFYQPDRRLSKHKGGVGLGLSIVMLIVKRHKGTIHLESEPGKGSRFELILPYAKTADS